MDDLDAIKDLAIRAGTFQAKIDEMGLGDPLKKENARLRRQLADQNKLQPCGHEQRFIVSGEDGVIDPEGKGRSKTNYCVMCQLADAEAEKKRLRTLLYGWAIWHTGEKPGPEMGPLVSDTHGVLGWGVGQDAQEKA